MNNIKVILGILITTFSFTACSEYIEEDNLSNVTAESFYVTADGFQALVNANYANLRDIYGDDAWLFCAGTDMYAEARDQEPPGLSQYTQLNSSSQGVDHLYETCYKAIQSANMGLHYAQLTESTSDLPKQVGELHFLRANAYFLLVQTYGGVSLANEFVTSPVLSFSRNTAEEVYTQILADLQAAEGAVATGAYNGKVNQRAVKNLKAKVYLTRAYESFGDAGDFAMAAQLADEVIGGQGLNLSFTDLWFPGNEMNEEVIFSVQFDPSSVSADPLNLGNRQANYFGPYLGGSEVAGNAPYRTYNLCPTDYALGLFTQDDERWEGTFMTEIFKRYYDYFDEDDHSGLAVTDFYEPQWFTAADKTNYLTTANLDPNFEYHDWGTHSAQVVSTDYATIPVKKFDDPGSPFGANGDDGRVSRRDFIVSRLAETYLIAAEAYLNTNPSTGLARLNVVRNRAGVTPATLAEFDIDYILDERGRELLGEYHRWFDLKRTGKLVERASMYHYLIDASNFNGANGELKILRPIPQKALDLNQNKDFKQNPAYE
ncbi:RagB/SusD family nutrient uptake outer membrane protein [Tamlana sp. I1]|uniref:RagB/SusD family nutrient uptake outer membrane protein n=1 Tax=Tamlana sp. I1 TaxID=2762061 RepID=UPI0018908D5B|nr:RagB/SusD family nutrient uptake outer membrane protein [Tamlana sp. I1]